MAIYINTIQVIADAVVEPVSLTDAKNWMRIEYTTDDTMIQNLLEGARKHIEKLTNLSLVNKKIRVNLDLTGSVPEVWMVDLPYGPVVCIDEVKYKTGLNTYDTLTKNDDFEVIGGKVWFYAQGNYTITYEAGYGTLPEDLASDILTLTTWSYENRGKKMNADVRSSVVEYPKWDGLNYHQYKKVVI